MKKTVIILLVLFTCINLSAQKWANIYGYPGTDETIREVIETYDHGYLISGGQETNNGTWLIKTDIDGGIIWEKFLLWNDVVLGRTQVAQDNNGNIISAYATFGSVGIWPLIVKLDSCGNKVWCRVFKDENFTKGWFDDVLILDNGDILALAYLDSEEEIELVFLYYIDANGNLLWKEGYASRDDYPHIRSANGDGIKKYGDNYIIHGDCYYPYPSDTTHFFLRPLFIMLDSEFNEQWIIPFGVSDSIIGEAYHTISLNDSVFMGVGKRRLPDEIRNTILMFYNIDGEELGYKQIFNDSITQGLTKNFISDIAEINDTLFLASTYFRFGEESGQWGEMIIDTAGTIYQFEIRDQSTSGQTTIVKTFDNKYTIGCGWEEAKTDWDIYMYKINEDLEHDTVYPGNYNYDSLCPYQIQSGEIDISNCLIVVDVKETPTPQEYFESLNTIPIKAYPNPVNGNEVTFELQNTKYHYNMELKCFNVYGKQVHTKRVYRHQGKSILEIQNWENGIYFVIVYVDGKPAGECKFVVQ